MNEKADSSKIDSIISSDDQIIDTQSRSHGNAENQAEKINQYEISDLEIMILISGLDALMSDETDLHVFTNQFLLQEKIQFWKKWMEDDPAGSKLLLVKPIVL